MCISQLHVFDFGRSSCYGKVPAAFQGSGQAGYRHEFQPAWIIWQYDQLPMYLQIELLEMVNCQLPVWERETEERLPLDDWVVYDERRQLYRQQAREVSGKKSIC